MARKEPQPSSTIPKLPPVSLPTAEVSKRVDDMNDAELVKLHLEICSMEPPECQRTYNPRDFRAHVLRLVTEKQKQIA